MNEIFLNLAKRLINPQSEIRRSAIKPPSLAHTYNRMIVMEDEVSVCS